MKTLTKLIFVMAFALGGLTVTAQQAPMYTHYMYNTLSVNPAYAGSRDALTITALHRSQWVGYKGAPSIQTLTMHAPIANEHIGLGLTILNDNIGPTNNTGVFANFAYIMRVSPKSRLALGLSGGVNIFQANLSTLALNQESDPVFLNDINNRVTPNFGFGAYYYRESFYAGISAPYLLQNKYSVETLADGSSILGKEKRHYFLIAGSLIKMTPGLDFKPTMLIKVTPAAPIQADLTASFVIAKKVLLGAMFRTGDAFGALVGLDISDQMHIGYSFDWSYGLNTGRYNYGSHEIMLRYDFIFSSKQQIHSPRNF